MAGVAGDPVVGLGALVPAPLSACAPPGRTRRTTLGPVAHRRPGRIGTDAQTLRRRAAGAWLQQLNGLLKRLCRNDYPYSQSHTLNGRKWLAFLDNRCPAAGLTRWMVLVEGAYKPECKLDDKAIAGLTQAVDTWIRKHV